LQYGIIKEKAMAVQNMKQETFTDIEYSFRKKENQARRVSGNHG
jgi:hypothetical protein